MNEKEEAKWSSLNSLPSGQKRRGPRSRKSRPKPPEPPVLQEIPQEILNRPLSNYELTPEEDTREVVFKPNPGPQTAFLAASEREVLFGGAAGGEPKSWFYRLLS